MKTSYILSSFIVLCLSVTVVAAANHSTLKIKHDGDSKNLKSGTKENASLNSANTSTSAAADINFDYLRFDVSKYADQDLDDELGADVSLLTVDNEFSYLKFDVSKYANPDVINPESIDADLNETDADYSYLKFDVNKYDGNNEDYPEKE
jgi:hypothetical protein